MSSTGTFFVTDFGRKIGFLFFPNNLIFGLSEVVEGPFLKFPIFCQNFEFSNFRPDSPLFRSYLGRTGHIFRWKLHIWVIRTTYLWWNYVYGSYGLFFSEKILIYEPSANPILEKVLIWSLLGLILVSIEPHLASIGSYLSPIELYLVPIEPYLALLDLIWALLSSIWSLLSLIWPYWALFGLNS